MMTRLDDKASERIARIRATSMLTDKELVKQFNITQYGLNKIRKQFEDRLKLTDKDWIYGALRTLNKSTIAQIVDYIDYKNRLSLNDKEIKRGLGQLLKEGYACNNNGTWNHSQRLIEVYLNKTSKFVSEVELGQFDLKKFKKLYKPKDWDYLMYEQFNISPDDIKEFEGTVLIDFDFRQFKYVLTCRQGESSD